MIERNFNLHLTAGHSTALVINVNQFDQGEKWIFTLYNENGTQYIPSTGAIVGIKSDGLGIINSGSVVDGKVVIMETEQMTAAVGKAVFELMIDSQTHGTANFIVLVEPKPGNNADLSESDLSLLQEAIDATSPLPTGGTVGQVLTKTANGSTWSNAGTPTQEQVADAVSDWADEHITVSTGVVIDTSLSVAGAAADAKKTGDEITDLKSAIQSGGSFNAEVKAALDAFAASVLQLAEKVAYIDEDGQDYYDDIDDAADALHSAMYPPVNLSSISAVYTQSGTVYDTDSLDDLKADLVVTAHYSDSTTAVVTNYTLSGTLTAGTSTITVTYGGKTTTFNVIVTASSTYVTNGLIAYWDGINNTGTGTHSGSATTWTDLINNYVLTMNKPSAVSWADDSLVFTGDIAQALTTDSFWQRPNESTIEVVFKTTNASTTQMICLLDKSDTMTSGYYNDRNVSIFSDNTIGFIGNSSNTYANPESSLTGIRKVAVQYTDFTVNHAYVNGVEASLSTKTHSFRADTTTMLVGGATTTQHSYPLTGQIYAIRVYNRHLTASELSDNLAYDNQRFSLGLTV